MQEFVVPSPQERNCILSKSGKPELVPRLVSSNTLYDYAAGSRCQLVSVLLTQRFLLSKLASSCFFLQSLFPSYSLAKSLRFHTLFFYY